MLAFAYDEGIKATSKGYSYCLFYKMFLQLEGGPIGLRLTAAIARLICLWFDLAFLARCTSLGIEVMLYKRYVDDVTVAARKITFNTWCHNKKQISIC